MISHERWNTTHDLLRKLKEKDVITKPTPFDRQILLDEAYLTEQALQKLGVSAQTSPSDLKHINTIITPELPFPPNALLIISILGMPKTAKTTTLIETYKNTAVDPPILWESIRTIIDSLPDESKTDFEEISRRQMLINRKRWEQIRINSLETDYVITERDWTDIPFLRAQLLHGRFKPKSFIRKKDNFLENVTAFPKPAHVVVNCLAKPATVLARESEVKPYPSVMQMPFLEKLYEQYLRFHYENTKSTFYGHPSSFIYASVDMSSETEWENIRSLERTINLAITSHHIGLFDGPKIISLPVY